MGVPKLRNPKVITDNHFTKAWEEYRMTDNFQDLKKSINQKMPYNENIIWWAFKAGYEAKKQQSKL